MAYTSAQLAALENAIAQGVQEVQYEDTRTKYRSLDEMLKLRDVMRDDLGLNSAKITRRYVSTSKGL